MKFIGISNICYGEPFDSSMLSGGKVSSAKVKAWLSAETTKEVKNSHDGTWGYTQDDPQISDYINELTGKPYHRDITREGSKTIKWTMGEYEFEDLVNLQNGEVLTESNVDVGWQSGKVTLVYKGIVAKTKTGNYICFSNAHITAKNDQQDKALGLGVTAVAMESEVENIKDEYRFKGSAIDTVSGNSQP